MSSQYFPPYVVGKSNNVKVVLNLRGYLRIDDKTLAKKKDLDYFWGKNYFDGDDGAQNYLVFQVKTEYFKKIVFFENFEPLTYYNNQTKNLKKLTEDDIIVQSKSDAKTTRSVVNIYIVYKISSKSITSSNVLRNWLFCATKVSNTATLKNMIILVLEWLFHQILLIILILVGLVKML